MKQTTSYAVKNHDFSTADGHHNNIISSLAIILTDAEHWAFSNCHLADAIHRWEQSKQYSSFSHEAPYLFIFLVLGMIHLAYLCQFGTVVGMLDGILGRIVLPSRHGLRRGTDSAATVLWTSHALGYQHVIQSQQLRVRRVIFLQATDTQACITTV